LGIAIGKLIEDCKQEFNVEKSSKKRFGFDAFNVLYQFLTTIRGVDGEPLKNNRGEVTSHLNGLFYRLINLLSYNIEIVFVFDGKSHSLKQKTKDKRAEKKEIAKDNYNRAVEEGNLEDVRKYSKQFTRLDDKILSESKELLLAMGVSYIEAPSEAEAQISYLTSIGQLDYTVSQDYDCLLFGSNNLVRNLTVSGKKKIPSKNIYLNITPEIIYLEKVIKNLGISREKLIWLALLIGTDFNDKVLGVGPVTALKLVKENNSFEELISKLKEKGKDVNFDYRKIQDIFLKPNISKEPKIIKGKFDSNKIKEILVNRADFSEERIELSLNKYLKLKEERDKQKTISDWF